MAKINKIHRISLSGGLIGLLLTNPRRALDATIQEYNADGWNAVYFDHHKPANTFVVVLQLLVLFLTLGLWTWGAGYLVLFEKEIAR